ncbi:hypothetical protein LUZ63_017827 [Rhynchospora breviuscula]|uniref:Uncharacterized protein n=1 Tax=Rhynchospora breviuscula TaxID=2022672 RepID=A0A9Q0C3A0_9POAL|nr:hypothetical protein LUZ63_017827 [Rhynchospora breviuscula]
MASSYLRLPSTGAASAATPPFPTPSPSSSQIVATISSHCSSKSKVRSRVSDLSVAYRIECRSPFLGTRPSGLYRSRSVEIGNDQSNKKQTLRRAVSADLQVFDEDEEFVKKLQELVSRGNPVDANRQKFNIDAVSESVPSTSPHSGPVSPASNHPWEVSGLQSAIAIPQGGIAYNCDLPASLRIIKQKKKKQRLANWEEGFREVGENALSSVNKAFSSMVFMIRELQSYTLQMRQGLFYEDIQDILSRVQQDLHASFVWLFQQIFSGTPTLMVSVMLLLANFTVYSMTNSVALAAPLSPPQANVVVAVVESNYEQKTNQPRFDRAAVKTSPGRTASVGGSGGGGKVRPVAGSTDDGRSEGPTSSRQINHAGTSSTVEVVREEDEEAAWNRIVEEAKEMQASTKEESLMDPNVLKWLGKVVTVELEQDAYSEYAKTDLHYQLAVQQEPENTLLLCNFAQFLQLVLHDNERAEFYYKKAVAVKPADGEAFSKYAAFLWHVKDDIGAAEENYLEAIQADPENSFHAANYAHFLWNTGGEDTCFPAA